MQALPKRSILLRHGRKMYGLERGADCLDGGGLTRAAQALYGDEQWFRHVVRYTTSGMS
jgi:hypothetical protein